MLLEELHRIEEIVIPKKFRNLAGAAAIGGAFGAGALSGYMYHTPPKIEHPDQKPVDNVQPKIIAQAQPKIEDPTIPDKPPEYKKDFINQNDWNSFRTALSNSGLPEGIKSIYWQIFAAEGGMNTRAGPRAGITGPILKLAQQAKIVDPKITSNQLTPEQIIKIYNFYFDNSFKKIGGKESLTSLNGPLSTVIADCLFRYGPTKGTNIIENAAKDIVERIPIKKRIELGIQQFKSNHIISKKVLDENTFYLLKTLSNNGLAKLLLDRITHHRITMKHALPGDVSRANHFNDQNG